MKNAGENDLKFPQEKDENSWEIQKKISLNWVF